MLLGNVIELRPTPEQVEYFRQCCGVRRFVFNECLKEWKRRHEADETPCKRTMIDYLNGTLKPAFPWIGELSARIARNAVDDLDAAFKNFFRNVKKRRCIGKKNRYGYPKFKKKGRGDHFNIRESIKFTVDGRALTFEKCPFTVRMRQCIRFEGTPKQLKIFECSGKWFASFLVDVAENPWPHVQPDERQPSVGVDLGIKSLATLSTGQERPASQPLKKQLKKLAKLQRRLARKQKGSNRRAKLKLKIQKLHYRIACQRQAVTHELTDHLTRNFDRIVIEDLNVRGMSNNRKLARAVLDVGFYEIRRQLAYKSFYRGVELVMADRWYPSSKLCWNCGAVNAALTLADRVWDCVCGQHHQRDLTGSINLDFYGRDPLERDLKRAQELTEVLSMAQAVGVDGANKPEIFVH
jgi:putative transposase